MDTRHHLDTIMVCSIVFFNQLITHTHIHLEKSQQVETLFVSRSSVCSLLHPSPSCSAQRHFSESSGGGNGYSVAEASASKAKVSARGTMAFWLSSELKRQQNRIPKMEPCGKSRRLVGLGKPTSFFFGGGSDVKILGVYFK